MVYEEPCGKFPKETVWKREGTFKNDLEGDQMSQMSFTVYQELSLTDSEEEQTSSVSLFFLL